MAQNILSRLRNSTVLGTLQRIGMRPFTRMLNTKRMSTLETQWHNAAHARDMLFVARVASRYRAYRKSDNELPLLCTRTGNSTIAPEAWEALYQPRRGVKREAQVDIIVPVTHSYEVALPALYGLLTSANNTPFRVVALLNQHPDHKLTDKLRRLQELDLFDLLVGNGEEGMNGLINFALQRHDTRDAIVIASHVEVADGWLDRLHNTALTDRMSTATVSPWLTAGGITGYPDATGSIAHALEPTALLDDICQHLFSDAPAETIDHPAAHALYICRNALHSVGLLNEKLPLPEALSLWSSLATEKGLTHLWARHTMLGTGPGYLAPNRKTSFVQPASHRDHAIRIDRARLARQSTGSLLVIEGIRPLTPSPADDLVHLTSDPSSPSLLRIGLPDIRLFPHLSFPLDTGFPALSDLCEELGITGLIIRQPAGFPTRMLEWITLFGQQAGLPYRLEISDDYLICPGLLGVAKTCAPEDLESGYRSFCDTHPLDSDGMPLWLWRVRSATLIEHAQSIRFSDDHVRSLFQRYFSIA